MCLFKNAKGIVVDFDVALLMSLFCFGLSYFIIWVFIFCLWLLFSDLGTIHKIERIVIFFYVSISFQLHILIFLISMFFLFRIIDFIILFLFLPFLFFILFGFVIHDFGIVRLAPSPIFSIEVSNLIIQDRYFYSDSAIPLLIYSCVKNLKIHPAVNVLQLISDPQMAKFVYSLVTV